MPIRKWHHLDLVVAHSLDAKVIFQSQGDLDPSLRHTLIFNFVFVIVLFVVGDVLGDVVGILVEFLDILEGPALAGIEHLGSHRPDAIDTGKLV